MTEALKFSIIIPAYNGAEYLGAAIQSVLAQTYQNFELIIVDDASKDGTPSVVRQFDDTRIRYFVHEANRGVDAARNLAIQNATGDVLAFLDQDDLFHPEKLQAHAELLQRDPAAGFTYNARFDLNSSSTTIRDLWRPPMPVNLADLLLGFPIAPSEMVIRRAWSDYLDLSKEPALIHGGEYVITGRLYLSGCRFVGIDRGLNYRRHYSGRVFSKLEVRCNAELEAQQRIFADPRCPPDILALRNTAFMNTYRMWAYTAFVQEETVLGRRFLDAAIRLGPRVLKGSPDEYVRYFFICSVDDESENHVLLLQRIFSQLPEELACYVDYLDWASGRGYLIKGVRALLWDSSEASERHFAAAAQHRIEFDETLIDQLTGGLLSYRIEFGDSAAKDKIRDLTPALDMLGGGAAMRRIAGRYAINCALRDYKDQNYSKVTGHLIPAFASNPAYLANRGVLSVIVRSILRI